MSSHARTLLLTSKTSRPHLPNKETTLNHSSSTPRRTPPTVSNPNAVLHLSLSLLPPSLPPSISISLSLSLSVSVSVSVSVSLSLSLSLSLSPSPSLSLSLSLSHTRNGKCNVQETGSNTRKVKSQTPRRARIAASSRLHGAKFFCARSFRNCLPTKRQEVGSFEAENAHAGQSLLPL